MTTLRLVCLVLGACAMALAQTCPPAEFDSVSDLDVLKYLRGNSSSRAWYIQQQMPNAYQPENELYCVRAVYIPKDPNNLQAGIQVMNTARRGSVTGSQVGSGTNGAPPLLAFPDNTSSSSPETRASKLRVGPAFLAARWQEAYGPYWVVAAGKSADNTNYDWAIVTGGAPRTVTAGGCVVGPVNPGPTDVNNSGFWLFSRRPVDPAAAAIMKSEAAGLGLDLSVLKVVQQQGCVYPALPSSTTSAKDTGSGQDAAAGSKTAPSQTAADSPPSSGSGGSP